MNEVGFIYLSWKDVNEFLFLCPDLDPDSDSVSMSRRGIEDKLVEEYRNCHYYKQTKADLGKYKTITDWMCQVLKILKFIQIY